MTRARRLVCIAAAACSVALSTGATVRAAEGLNAFEDVRPRAAVMPPLPSPAEDEATGRPVKGNPLWGVPVRLLNATRERPIFSASRRPPMAAVSMAPPPPAAKAPVVAEPDEPTLNLVGTIAGSGEGYAVFLDNATHAIVRLKTGEGDGGWILRSVADRTAVLEKNHRTAVIRLPSPKGDQK